MSASVSIRQWRQSKTRERPVLTGHGLDPEVLLKSGILGNPAHPYDALRRARGLVLQGQYRDAKALLSPHAKAQGAAGREIAELLGQCAMHMMGQGWREYLTRALMLHQTAHDAAGISRVHRLFGEQFLDMGQLELADRHFRDAESAAGKDVEIKDSALIDSARAQIRLRAGLVDRALKRIDHALFSLQGKNQPRAEALALLNRARILACKGEPALVARDLLLAEKNLGASGGVSDRLQARLTRAETLVTMGLGKRAQVGLTRLLAEAVELDDASICAHAHRLLGEAYRTSDPSAARRQLTRARHLYDAHGHTYSIVACDIALARVELRMGLDPYARLSHLQEDGLKEWPVLLARLRLVHGEVTAAVDPDAARCELYKARSWALNMGHRSLAREVDQVLFDHGLVAAHEIIEFTPVDSVSSAGVFFASGDASQVVTAPRPSPLVFDDDGAKMSAQPYRVRAEKIVRAMSPTKPYLLPPRSMGPRLTG